MNKKHFLVIWSILLAGLLIGTFTDLQFSMRLFDRENGYAEFIDIMGMIPSLLLVELCCCIFSWYYRNDTWIFTCGILLTMIMGIVCVDEANRWLKMNIYLVAVLGLLLSLMFIAVFCFTKPQITEKQYVTARSIMLAALCIFLLTSGMKTLWGRRRFYTMDDPALQFSNWYVMKPFAINDDMRSFPSGHTSFSSMMLFVCVMDELLNLKINRKLAAVLTVLWTVAVMTGRIIYGAHFLTDTCVGALIGTVCVYNGLRKNESLSNEIRV